MPITHMFLAVLVALMWGMNFVAAKFSVEYFPPFLVSAIRFVLVSLILLPVVARPPMEQLRRIFAMATMSALHFALLFMALAEGLTIASSALVGQLGVPFACIMGAVFLRDMLGKWRMFGIAVSFCGMGIVAGAPNIMEHPTGFLVSVMSALAWGVANVLVKRVEGVSSMSMLAWMSACTVPTLLLVSLLLEYSEWPPLMGAPAEAVAGILYTVFGSTLVAYGLWYFLLSRHNVSQVTPFSLLTPVFGIAAGQLFFEESLSTGTIAGGLITLLGVAIIVVRRPKTIAMGEAT